MSNFKGAAWTKDGYGHTFGTQSVVQSKRRGGHLTWLIDFYPLFSPFRGRIGLCPIFFGTQDLSVFKFEIGVGEGFLARIGFNPYCSGYFAIGFADMDKFDFMVSRIILIHADEVIRAYHFLPGLRPSGHKVRVK